MASKSALKSLAKNWVEKIRQGDIRTVARTCSLIENEDPLSQEILPLLYPFSGNAIVVGITGPPGVGKSTLLSCLIDEALAHRYQVGVIAVDPSSPISGGALLADRLRMVGGWGETGLGRGKAALEGIQNHRQVYIRSLATRGSLGGLSFAAFGILRVLEAMGKEFIFVETVGAGQNEIEVTNLATTTLYVTIPNLGDDIQALKAGILELADIFIVNKADIGNAETSVSQLRSALLLRDPNEAQLVPAKSEKKWLPIILSVSALRRFGIAQIFSSILRHSEFLKLSNALLDKRKKQVSAELFVTLERHLTLELRSKLTEKQLNSLLMKKTSPYLLVRSLLKNQR